MSIYPLIPLKEVATIRSGYAFKSADWTTRGVPVVKIANVSPGTVTLEGCSYVAPATARKAGAFLLEYGDPLIAMSGATVGKVGRARFRDQALINQRVGRFRVLDEDVLDLDYLYYFLQLESTFQSFVHGAYGSAQPNISPSIILDTELPLPPINEQRLIGQVLSSLDDKIAANTKLATTAKTLADSKFKLLMRGAEQTATVDEIMSLEYGKSLPTTRRVAGHVDVFGSGGIVGSHNQSLSDGPGVIVGRKGTAGAVHWAPVPFFPIDTTFYVKPKVEEASHVFCYFLLKTLRLDEMNSDSAVPGLNRNEALATPIKRPEVGMTREFTSYAMHLFELASQANIESKGLEATRDALLPHLMSGKLRVEDVVKVVEETV